MSQPAKALYQCNQIRLCEQHAKNVAQTDEDELMSQAGADAFSFLLRHYPKVRHLAVYCGAGNNAGDGYVLARLAHEHGLSVIVYQGKAVEDLPIAAKNAALDAVAAGLECQFIDEPLDGDTELIVDALLGIGFKGPLYGVIAGAIEQINASGLPIVSLDIPSGLNADTGQIDPIAVKATKTLTFIGLKVGMYTLDGPDFCGEVHCSTLKLDSILANITPSAWLLTHDTLPLPMPKRTKNSHKGDYGHVLIIGGGPGMPGAVSLTAKAALRAGAGAVTIATWPGHVTAILPLIPEAMIWGISTAEELLPLFAKASLCVIGPGLGESDWAQSLFLAAMTSQLPMVIDASASRFLAKFPQVDDNWILTPHPGEAAALLACPTATVQADRYQSVNALQQQYGGVVVLKGCGSLIQTSEKTIFVCTKGNPAMASAGMGDVLTGVIAGLCAQGFSLSSATKLGVWVHAVAGDRAFQTVGGSGLLASDLIDNIPYILHCARL